MSTLRVRQRSMCSSCGNRCYVVPVELLVHQHHGGFAYWLWIQATLCPPCRLAKYDWWIDHALRTERVFV